MEAAAAVATIRHQFTTTHQLPVASRTGEPTQVKALWTLWWSQRHLVTRRQRSDQRQLKEIKVRLTLENTILENVLNYSNWTIYDNVFKYIVGFTTTCIYVM